MFTLKKCVCCICLLIPATIPAQMISSEQRFDLVDAAKNGEVEAQSRLGIAYAEGTVGFIDYPSARKWLELAMQSGDPEASAEMGSLYLHGYGVEANGAKAFELVTGSASQGSPLGLRLLGQMYESGLEVKMDFAKAAELYTQAVAKGDKRALDLLGILYFQGRGVPRNKKKAVNYWLAGASVSEPWSCLHLAKFIESNPPGASKDGVIQPLRFSSRALYESSAKAGNRPALHRLGQIYQDGIDVIPNQEISRRYYARASVRGYGPSTAALARIEETAGGDHLPLARSLYRVASKQGELSATSSLRKLGQSTTDNSSSDPPFETQDDLQHLLAAYFSFTPAN